MNMKHLGAAALATLVLSSAGGAFAQNAGSTASSDAAMTSPTAADTTATAPVTTTAPVEEEHHFPWGLLGLLGLAGLAGLRRKPDVHVNATDTRTTR